MQFNIHEGKILTEIIIANFCIHLKVIGTAHFHCTTLLITHPDRTITGLGSQCLIHYTAELQLNLFPHKCIFSAKVFYFISTRFGQLKYFTRVASPIIIIYIYMNLYETCKGQSGSLYLNTCSTRHIIFKGTIVDFIFYFLLVQTTWNMCGI